MSATSASAGTLRGRGWVVHCTSKNDSPAAIARLYGVSERSLRASSGTIRRAVARARRAKTKRGRRVRLRAHMRVKVAKPRRLPVTRDMVLRLKRGASLAWLAKKYGTSISLLRCINDLGSRVVRVRAGRRRRGRSKKTATRRLVLVRLSVPPKTARARGSPRSGSLVGAERLPEAPGLFVRSPGQAWGTHRLITGILRAVAQVQWDFADTHPLVAGHLSRRKGGHLVPHRSHQNGLDADLGYYHLGKAPHDRFVVATARNLDRKRTWALLRALLDSHQVQYIFINTSLQRLLRRYAARARRVTAPWCRRWLAKRARRKSAKRRRSKGRPRTMERCLDAIFQAKGRKTLSGTLIRHERGHDDHLHVRFLSGG